MSYSLNNDLRQRHVEKWSEAYAAQFTGTVVAHNGANVRAGVKAGIITGLTAEEVDDMRPRDVRALSEELSELLNESLKPLEKKQ